jgi:hydrogenase maturation protease
MARWSTSWSVTDARYLLIIGYGNSLRRDDGAGLLLAQELAAAWQAQARPVHLLTLHQLGPELALDLAEPAVAGVLFVDTQFVDLETGDAAAPAVTLTPLPAGPASPSLTHHVAPEALLYLAEQLYGRRLPAWLLRVPGFDFAHGEGLSSAVAQMLAAALALADAWWGLLTADW